MIQPVPANCSRYMVRDRCTSASWFLYAIKSVKSSSTLLVDTSWPSIYVYIDRLSVLFYLHLAAQNISSRVWVSWNLATVSKFLVIQTETIDLSVVYAIFGGISSIISSGSSIYSFGVMFSYFSVSTFRHSSVIKSKKKFTYELIYSFWTSDWVQIFSSSLSQFR